MSFGNMFDGYCVIHAKYATGNRRVWFEKELKRTGINDYTIIEASQIDDHDPRLAYYASVERRTTKKYYLSHIDTLKRSIDFAKSKNWQNMVVFEDDIRFRKQFKTWWPEVECEVKKYNWDILFLYRWGRDLLEEPCAKTALVPIQATLCTHCFVVRDGVYSMYQNALDYCMHKGKAADRATYEYLNRHNCRIVATSKNLAGQRGVMVSGAFNSCRPNTLSETFRVKDKRVILRWIESIIYRAVRKVMAILLERK